MAASPAAVVADLKAWLNAEPVEAAGRFEAMFDLGGLLESLLTMWGMKVVM